MHLVISEFQPADVVLDWPSLWADDLDNDLNLGPVEIEPSDYLEPLPSDRLPAWYQPRIGALRILIVGSVQ